MSASKGYQYLVFNSPAYQAQKDLRGKQDLLDEFSRQWTTNVTGWTKQAINGGSSLYYNQLEIIIPTTAAIADPVLWPAFPFRFIQYYGQGTSPANPYNYPMDASQGATVPELYRIADMGCLPDGAVLPRIPHWGCVCKFNTYCQKQDYWNCPQSQFIEYGPYGPRGWMDEYCEWSVTRDKNGNIVRIDFVCENPEYWNTLWMIDPGTVRSLYEETLNFEVPDNQKITVNLEDLYLYDPKTGQPVIDPSTGRYAYNPLNKWNSGSVSYRLGSDPTKYYGGAMHLTATPNTLQTEMGLAGVATLEAASGNTDTLALLCCIQSGQPYRNSDPHITQSVNRYVVNGGLQVALADPPGLYIQTPEFDSADLRLPPNVPNLPAGAKASDCWHVVRGTDTLIDPVTNQPFPGNLILHAVFQIPKAWTDAGVNLTISDLLLGYEPAQTSEPIPQNIRYASQVAQTISVALYARGLPAVSAPVNTACVVIQPVSTASPQQLFYAALWNAFYNTLEPNPMQQPISLASNSTFIAPVIKQGTTGAQMALTYISGTSDLTAPTVSVPEGDITFTPSAVELVNYAVPGNSYPFNVANQVAPGTYLKVVFLQVAVPLNAQLGLRTVQVADTGQSAGSAPALLNVAETPKA
jgi:hypothetical protein